METKQFNSATTLVIDIPNYDSVASQISRKEMLTLLTKLWAEYDIAAKRWGVLNFEAVGNAYIGCVGAPHVNENENHASQAAQFALDVLDVVQKFKISIPESLQIRVGLSSGPVTIGFDTDNTPKIITGDTVYLASKVEASARPMCILVTESTYEHLKGHPGFQISKGGTVKVKGTLAQTYVINGRN
jgi:class 3 adenylate cyclase